MLITVLKTKFIVSTVIFGILSFHVVAYSACARCLFYKEWFLPAGRYTGVELAIAWCLSLSQVGIELVVSTQAYPKDIQEG